jgi:hypothetical protein
MPPIIVEAPPLSTPPYNLLAQLQVIDVADDRFVSGVEWVAEPDAEGVTYNLSCGEGIVNEQQTLTVVGGTFTLSFDGQVTAPIPFNATAAQVRAALEALGTIGVGNVTVTGGPLPGGAVTVTFVAGRGGTQQAQLGADSSGLDAGVVTPATTVQGAEGVAKPGAANRNPTGAFAPFGVVAYDRCGTFGWQALEYQARARRALAAVASTAVEAEYWEGALVPTNEHLAAAHAAVLGGAGMGRREALAELVQGLADAGAGTGVIHARPYLVQNWLQDNALEVRNGKLYTKGGHLVVQGAGYTGTGPADEAVAGGVEWAYATDNLVVVRGPVMLTPGNINEATDRATNTVVFRAEQAYGVITNHKAHLAVSVDTAVA